MYLLRNDLRMASFSERFRAKAWKKNVQAKVICNENSSNISKQEVTGDYHRHIYTYIGFIFARLSFSCMKRTL
jgi:hypothetical protein